MKYRVTLTAIGDFALQLLQTRGSMIIFDKDVPYAYANMVVSHTKAEVKQDIAPGDTVILADREYRVTGVGEEANKNLREHGHCTLSFGEERTVEQPGEIVLAGDRIPRVMVGDIIEIFKDIEA